jgi:2-hydroxymuconate-semialdehyde hydrolase
MPNPGFSHPSSADEAVKTSASIEAGKVLDRGSGNAVLLLHGTAPGTTAEGNFHLMLPALEGYRVLAPDLLGFGASPKPLTVDYGPKLWAAQAWELLEAREIENVSIIGNSAGARVGLEMATQSPDRIDSLTLLSTRVLPSNGPTAVQRMLRAYTPSRPGMAELIRECFVTDAAQVTEELVETRYRSSAAPGAHEAMQRVFAGMGTWGIDLKTVAKFSQPVLVLHGREDRIVPEENSVALAMAVPQADVHLLANTGHWLQLERADLVNNLIGNFLSGVYARERS